MAREQRITVIVPAAMLEELDWHRERGHALRPVPTGRSLFIAWQCSCRIEGFGPIEVR